MKIISRPRMAGKTYLILEAMRRNPNSAMVCISQAEVERLRRDNPDIEEWRFITTDAARRGTSLAGRREWVDLYVDNLDSVLFYLFGKRVTLASMTEEVEVDRD